jgi:uncharacterized iron-regulated membrane protein
MSLSHRFIKTTRSIHLYLGVFTAPALMFFAITGGLQTFSLHETTRGSDYKPPAWLASAAQLHKKQTPVMPVRRARPPEGSAPAGQPATAPTVFANGQADSPAGNKASAIADRPADTAAAKPKRNLLPMKIFFALVSLSLLVSTLTGLYMAWRFSRKPKWIGGIFLAGIAVPIGLLFL